MNNQQQQPYPQQQLPGNSVPQQIPALYPQQPYPTQPSQVPNVQQTAYQHPFQTQVQGQNIVFRTTVQKPQMVWVDFDSVKAKALGIIQIIVSLLCFVLNGAGIPLERKLEYEDKDCYWSWGCNIYYYRPWLMVMSFGFWCGTFYLISGALAVAAAKKRTGPLVKGTLGMSVISCFAGFSLLGSSAAALGVVSGDSNYKDEDESAYGGYITVSTFLLILSFVEIICSIWACHLCGTHLCPCRNGKTQTVVQYTNNQTVGMPQFATSPAGGMQQFTVNPAGGMHQFTANPSGGMHQFTANPSGGMQQFTANPSGGMQQFTANPAGGMAQPMITVPGQPGTAFVPQQEVTMAFGMPSTALPAFSSWPQPAQDIAASNSMNPPPYEVAQASRNETQQF